MQGSPTLEALLAMMQPSRIFSSLLSCRRKAKLPTRANEEEVGRMRDAENKTPGVPPEQGLHQLHREGCIIANKASREGDPCIFYQQCFHLEGCHVLL